MKFFTKEIKIALTAIVGILILFYGINFLKGKSLLANNHIYYVVFNDINGLSASSPIFANGFQVGTVEHIEYKYNEPGKIVVTFGVDKNMRIPQGSTAEIESDFMGNVKMNLLLNTYADKMLNTGDTLTGQLNQSALAQAANLLPAVEKILPKLDSIAEHLNTLFGDPAIAHSLHNVENITTDLTVSTRELNTLLAGMNKQMPGLLNKADGVLTNADKVADNLAALEIDKTMQQIEQTLANVKQVSEKLNNNDSSMGLLLNDKSLYNNLNSTLKDADQLLKDLKQNPKRYINISVFGRKAN